MDQLLNQLYNPGVFCIPQNILDKNTSDDLSVFNKVGLTDNLLVLKGKDSFLLKDGFDIMFLLEKHNTLNSSVYKILNMRKTNDADAFLFFLNNYYNALQIWTNFSEITKKEAKTSAKNYTPEIQYLLDFQFQAFTHHKIELDHYFNNPINSSYKKTKEQYQFSSTKVEEVITKNHPVQPNTNIHLSNKKTKTENTLLPSIKEIDNYILQTVFKVHIENNDF